jgi:hypothetical protein
MQAAGSSCHSGEQKMERGAKSEMQAVEDGGLLKMEEVEVEGMTCSPHY